MKKTNKLQYPKYSKGVSKNRKPLKVVKKKHTKQIQRPPAKTRRMYKGYEVLTMKSLVPFGKYKEYTMEWLLMNDIHYFKWLLPKLKNKIDFSDIGDVKPPKTTFINSVTEIYW